MEHTKEPWKLQDDGIFVSVVDGDDSMEIIPAMRSNQCLHDFRRIVACVNACSGIPTDELEVNEYEQYIIETGTQIGELRAQRNIAWKELKEIRATMNANPKKSTSDEVMRIVVQREELLDALKESRTTLERANEIGVNTVICDTIWHTPYETLFDFMDEAIAKAEAKHD